MQTPYEGYIKFKQQHTYQQHLPYSFADLVVFRNKLAALQLIGVYPDGIGFGNISKRIGLNGEFIISGTQTGQVVIADAAHFVLVKSVDFSNNTVFSEGPLPASSESLTHAAIYAADKKIQAVIHVHHNVLWRNLLNKVSTIDASIAYGTIEMADAITLQVNAIQQAQTPNIIVTAGHEDGIFTFGTNLNNAFTTLMNFYEIGGVHSTNIG